VLIVPNADDAERVTVTKDHFTEGYHVFLDGLSVCGGDKAWCEKIGTLLRSGIDWVEEHGGSV
jgi:hypothetical protein